MPARWRSLKPESEGDVIVIDLPIPPSLNNAFPTSKLGRRYPSAEYKAWKTQAAWEVNIAKCGCLTGPVQIAIHIREPKRANADIDNRIKLLVDLMVDSGVIDGDSAKTVRKVSAEWSREIERARIEIRRCVA